MTEEDTYGDLWLLPRACKSMYAHEHIYTRRSWQYIGVTHRKCAEGLYASLGEGYSPEVEVYVLGSRTRGLSPCLLEARKHQSKVSSLGRHAPRWEASEHNLTLQGEAQNCCG